MEHRFIEQLKQSRGESAPLNQALIDFSTPKELTVQNFKEGVKRFIMLANMIPDERVAFYGNRYAGLYDNNHLAELWNTTCSPEDMIAPHALDSFAPSDWEIIGDAASISFKYMGLTPAAALDELLRGPTVIDCGIFCQLGIWFGIRYVLGDNRFNNEFGNQPFWITRSNFEAASEGFESQGSPLFSFFTTFIQDSVSIEHVFNDRDYRLKHPGGNNGGQNSLVIDNRYYTFTPLIARNGFTRTEVIQELLDALNAAPDSHDEEAIKVFFRNSDFFQSRYGSIYKFEFSAVPWFKLLACNITVLEAYANLLDNIPECKQKMAELFSHDDQGNGKINFIASFTEEDPAVNGEKYEAFFATPLVNETFQQVLKINPGLFTVYYRGILRVFIEYYQSYASITLSLEDYTKRQNEQERDIPSFIHFNFDTFLAGLSIGSGLSPIKGAIPDPKRLKPSEHSSSVTESSDVRFFTSVPALANEVSRVAPSTTNRSLGIGLGGDDSC